MKKLIVVSSFLLSFLLILSCSKTETNPKTKTDLLVANVWRASKVTEIRSGKTTPIFEKGVTPTSARDDLGKVRITFFKDGTFSSINADNGKESGIWKFTNNESQIEINTQTKSKPNILYIDKIDEGIFNFTEKDGSNSAMYEFIPE
jgi:hypothetical protein